MHVKRLYATPRDWVRQVNAADAKRITETNPSGLVDPSRPEGACLNAPPFAGLSVAHTGMSREQNFARATVEEGLELGYLSIGKGQITLHAVDGDLVYKIVRGPGRYCCHCAQRIGEGGKGDKSAEAEAQAHVVAAHAGIASPDKGNPAGYRWLRGFETLLEAGTHDKRKAKPGDPFTFPRLANDFMKARRERRDAAIKAGKKKAIVAALLGAGVLLASADPSTLSLAMANFAFNITKSRAGELYNRVDTNDPAASTLIVIPLETSGLETQANLEDSDTHTEVIDGTTNEATTGNWARKTLTDADIVAFAPDDTNNRVDLVIPDQTWTAVTGNAVSALTVNYASVASPTDSQIVPISHHDFAITPDGSDVTVDVPATGFYRST